MPLQRQQDMIMTTTGPKPLRGRPPLCMKCGQRKPGLQTMNANGQAVCLDCSGSLGAGVVGPQFTVTVEEMEEDDIENGGAAASR